MQRYRSIAVVMMVVAGSTGCGADEVAAPDPELDEFERTVERALDEQGKADSSSPALQVGDIVPGSVVQAELSPSRPLVGWTFRADGRATINARAALPPAAPVVPPPAPPARPTAPPAPTTRMVLYRRTSCLGRWQSVARGLEVLSTRLAGEGEYLLVSGARDPNASGTVQASFTADRDGKVITDTSARAFKIRNSWFPADALERLDAAGLDSFTALRDLSPAAAAKRTGLSATAITELQALAKWLDVPHLDYSTACALKSENAEGPEEYYELSRAAQDRLARRGVPLGSIPVDPTGSQPCVAIGPHPVWDPGERGTCSLPDDGSPVRGPRVDWHWYPSQQAPIEHNICTRPWQLSDITNAPSEPEQKRWYPDPALGWDVLAYRFGGTGSLGYILFYNQNIGVMRLFTYLPTNVGYNSQVTATLDLVRPNEFGKPPVASWTFPLEDVPPSASRLGTGAQQSTLLWRHTGRNYENLAPGGIGQTGRWLRAEAPVLYDPVVYEQNLAAGGRLTRQSVVALRLSFNGLNVGEADLWADLGLTAQGSAVPTSGRGPLGALKDTFMTALQGGAGAATVAGWLSIAATSATGIGLISTAALAGGFFGLYGNSEPPAYSLKLTGAVTGRITGRTFNVVLLNDMPIHLSGTYRSFFRFTPGDPDGGPRPGVVPGSTVAGPASEFQRCHGLRLGAVGLVATDGVTPDPRPPQSEWTIPVWVDRCGPNGLARARVHVASEIVSCSEADRANPTVSPINFVGVIRRAPWANIEVRDESVRLEVLTHAGPTPAPWRGDAELQVSPVVTLDDGGQRVGPIELTEQDLERLKARQGRVYLRWSALLEPTDGRGTPHAWTYALDVTDHLGPIAGDYLPTCSWHQEPHIPGSPDGPPPPTCE